MKNIFASLVVLLVATIAVPAESVKIELPVEMEVYKQAPGADLANAQCLTCHSADYASMQPPMPAKFWKGAVDKMISKYGAPVPTNQVDAIVNYFANNYGTETMDSSAIPAAVKETSKTLDAKKLMLANGCFNCHTVENKLIGPAFKAVAEKYKGNSEAMMKVSHQITHGGSGLWGPLPMPPFKQFSEAEITALAKWILQQK